MNYTLTHLKELEAESIHIIRETFAQFNKPAILFSGGKDSIVLTHLAKKDRRPQGIKAYLNSPQTNCKLFRFVWLGI